MYNVIKFAIRAVNYEPAMHRYCWPWGSNVKQLAEVQWLSTPRYIVSWCMLWILSWICIVRLSLLPSLRKSSSMLYLRRYPYMGRCWLSFPLVTLLSVLFILKLLNQWLTSWWLAYKKETRSISSQKHTPTWRWWWRFLELFKGRASGRQVVGLSCSIPWWRNTLMPLRRKFFCGWYMEFIPLHFWIYRCYTILFMKYSCYLLSVCPVSDRQRFLWLWNVY